MQLAVLWFRAGLYIDFLDRHRDGYERPDNAEDAERRYSDEQSEANKRNADDHGQRSLRAAWLNADARHHILLPDPEAQLPARYKWRDCTKYKRHKQ